jgi:GT2 family glycosyltransferase
MASAFGAGIVRARATPAGQARRVAGEELVGCNLMIAKGWFQKVGGLDESLYPGEDVDLLKRLHAEGAVLIYDPEAKVQRTRRRSLQQLAYQFYRYGRARGLGFYKMPRALDLIFLAPAALLVYLALSAWLPWEGLALYAGLALLEGLRIGWKLRSSWAAALCSAMFMIQHLAYGWGTLAGLLRLPTRSPGPVLGVKRHVLEL